MGVMPKATPLTQEEQMKGVLFNNMTDQLRAELAHAKTLPADQQGAAELAAHEKYSKGLLSASTQGMGVFNPAAGLVQP